MSKGGRCVRLANLLPSCAVVLKSGNLNFLEPSGPVHACNGTDLPFYLSNISTNRTDFMKCATDVICQFSHFCELFLWSFSRDHLNITDKEILQGPPKKCIHTLTKENSTLYLIDYCKFTIYFRQHNNIIYVFTSV